MTSHRPLLQTKLHQPPLRPDIVPRPRLLDQLNDGLHGKLTLVTAPAGFGKTTLVINWLNQRPPSQHTAVAWLSLDERDDDPHRFYTYLLAAYQQANPALGHKAMPLLAHDSLEPEQILTHLLNDLQSQPALLVLDDFHLVTAVEIRHGIQFLLDNLPPHSHLVLTSRHTPQLQLSRWRARRQMTEITVQDLRFLPEEAGTLLHQELGRELDSPALETLLRRTEGWAAGLQLAALSLKREPHPDQFIAQFAGTDRYVLDYLLDEVFAGQSDEMRQFLLTTAVLDRFCASLCDALTNGQPPAQTALPHLEQSNLFIIPLDNERRWFRYHHLFRDLLRHRLSAHHSPTHRQNLLLAASQWCEGETLFEEAVQYALAAQAYDHAAQLLEKTALFTLWGAGDAQTIAQQIQRLPPATLAAFPRLYIGLYWAMLYMGELTQAKQYLERAEQAAQTSSQPLLACEITAARASISGIYARSHGRYEEAIAIFQTALTDLAKADAPTVMPAQRAHLLIGLGGVFMYLGDLDAAARAASEVLELAEGTNDTFFLLQGLDGLAQVAYRYGQLHKSLDLCQQALAIATKHGRAKTPAAGMIMATMSDIYLEWNDIQQAIFYLDQSIQLGQQGQIIDILAAAYLGRLWANLHHYHNYPAAQKQLTELYDLLPTVDLPDIYKSLEAIQAEVNLKQGNLEAALQWMAQNELHLSDRPPAHYNKYEYLLLMEAHWRQARATGDLSHLPEVLALIQFLHQPARQQGWHYRLLSLEILAALTHEALGDHTAAQQALHRALTTAAPENMRLRFLKWGAETMVPLLHTAVSAPNLPTAVQKFAHTLLTDFEQQTPPIASDPTTEANEALPEPLTERELEILALLGQALSTKQIAARLVLSPGTVKWHINNVYSKLGVHGRVELLKQAQALGLVT